MSADIVLGATVAELPPKTGRRDAERWARIRCDLPETGWVEVAAGLTPASAGSSRQAALRHGVAIEVRNKRVYVSRCEADR